jgi:hypothetical protein
MLPRHHGKDKFVRAKHGSEFYKSIASTRLFTSQVLNDVSFPRVESHLGILLVRQCIKGICKHRLHVYFNGVCLLERIESKLNINRIKMMEITST